MTRIFNILPLFLLPILLSSQEAFVREKRDYIWTLGFGLVTNPQGKNFWLDFNDTPVSTHERPRTMSIDIANAGMCDLNGNLLFTSNGFVVMNNLHEIINNGDGLNPGVMTDDWLSDGQPLDQGAIALPLPESDSLYYLFHARREYLFNGPDIYGISSKTFPLFYSLVNISENNIQGQVLQKNVILINDKYVDKII